MWSFKLTCKFIFIKSYFYLYIGRNYFYLYIRRNEKGENIMDEIKIFSFNEEQQERINYSLALCLIEILDKQKKLDDGVYRDIYKKYKSRGVEGIDHL